MCIVTVFAHILIAAASILLDMNIWSHALWCLISTHSLYDKITVYSEWNSLADYFALIHITEFCIYWVSAEFNYLVKFIILLLLLLLSNITSVLSCPSQIWYRWHLQHLHFHILQQNEKNSRETVCSSISSFQQLNFLHKCCHQQHQNEILSDGNLALTFTHCWNGFCSVDCWPVGCWVWPDTCRLEAICH